MENCEHKLNEDPTNLSVEELEVWREKHNPDDMGFCGAEGIDGEHDGGDK